jgi:hypothetical protein
MVDLIYLCDGFVEFKKLVQNKFQNVFFIPLPDDLSSEWFG